MLLLHPTVRHLLVAAALGAGLGAVLAVLANVPGEFASLASAVGALVADRLREEAVRRGIRLPF